MIYGSARWPVLPGQVVRLERENELEEQRRKTMEAEGRAAANGAKQGQPGKPSKGAPGRGDQLAMVG